MQADGDSWVEALSEALNTLGMPASALSHIQCETSPDGAVRVTERSSGAVVVIRETEASVFSAPPISHLQGLDDASHDAPDPTATRAFTDREEWGDEQLARLSEEAAELAGAPSVRRAAELALDLLMRHVPAAGASVLTHDESKDVLRFLAVRGAKADSLLGLKIPASAGIAGMVLMTGATLHMREAGADPSHYHALDERTGYRTHGLVAVPISPEEGRVVGVIELLNPFGSVDFADWHTRAARVVADALAGRLVD